MTMHEQKEGHWTETEVAQGMSREEAPGVQLIHCRHVSRVEIRSTTFVTTEEAKNDQNGRPHSAFCKFP